MRLGVYGGSFDPIHRGHIDPVLAAVGQLELDRVLYLPTAVPPHKPGQTLAPIARRCAMAELALLPHPRLEVSDLEMRGRVSYTVETLEHLATTDPDADLHLLIGSDSLAMLDSWRRWQDLFSLSRLVVLRRPGWERSRVEASASAELWERAAKAVTWVDHPPVDLSATRIRARFAGGGRIPDEWMPPAVVQYVRKYRLYS